MNNENTANGEPTLRSLATQRGLHIGAAVNEHALRQDPVYRDVLAREFNMITCENALKWGPLRPTRDRFAFENADRIVDFATVFHWAHEADPDARLFYNDYAAEALNTKSDAIYATVKELLRRRVPIHGVGLQMHVCQWAPPKPKSVARNIRRLNALGLDVHITEMDVRIKEPATDKDLKAQARVYRDIAKVCLKAAQCTALVTWGVTDRYSWIPHAFKGNGSALLFDTKGDPKPAYHALHKTLER